MSEVKLVLRDAERDLSGTIHGSMADRAVAALSADPVTIAELNVAMERFYKPSDNHAFFSCFGSGTDDEPYDAGLVVIDLAAKLVVAESTYSSPARRGWVNYHNGGCATDIRVEYSLDDEWSFSFWADSWRGLAEDRRRKRAEQTEIDVRRIVYGQPLIEFLAAGCFREFARRDEIKVEVHQNWIQRRREWNERYADGPQPDPESLSLDELANKTSPGQEIYASVFYDTIKDIHAAWLLTPRAELNGECPRDVLLAKHDHIGRDEESRCMQWTRMGECPRGLEESSHAFRFGGFGTHELVKHYELVRELLWSCWERLETGDPLPEAFTVGDFLSEEVPRLERVRDEWLATPDPELHMRTPRSIIDRERARLPEGGAYEPIDVDCPCCQMLADMPGPSFWHLDGSSMDWEFAFAIHQKTREEWDKEQADWAELDRRHDAEWKERRSLGLPNNSPVGKDDADDSVWSRSSVTVDGPEVPLGIRLFRIGTTLAEVITDLREADGDNQVVIDKLNRDFGNLREVVGQTSSQDFNDSLIDPVLAEFRETLLHVADSESDLEQKCVGLARNLETFAAVPDGHDRMGPIDAGWEDIPF